MVRLLLLRLVQTAVWLTAAVIVVCALLYAFVYHNTSAYVYDTVDAVPTTQVAMVLGASVTSGGVLSPILQARAEQAIALYNAHKVSKILVTGDNATLTHDEVDPVGKYLAARGVPVGDIFLDHAGFDTYSSMYRARDVFGVVSLTIVSQPFHLPRAVYIARNLGLVAYATPADTNGLNAYNYAREVPATVKATYDILYSRVPKYLGTQYPITGSGESTWGGFSSTTVWR